jgi:predicted phosphoadenosine phosphosulfate sulfurtransferase
MYQAGIPYGNMRIDEPFGDTQRHTLWLYQAVEPDLWAKFVARISGVNTAALYCKEKGNILGNRDLTLPEGHTWESFANFILETMPQSTAEHYRNKIAVYLKWYADRDYESGIPDYADISLENKGLVPSWRKVCKTLLRNDYWCRWLGFSPTKSTAYKKYQDLMKRRRKDWGIYADTVNNGAP